MDRMITDERGMGNIDLMFALVLVIAVVFTANSIMPDLSQQDKSWRIDQYMTAVRTSDNLVQNGGYPVDWEQKWISGNHSEVKIIGLVYFDHSNPIRKVLNLNKVEDLMGQGYRDNITGMTWWEFPNSTTRISEKQNATRALGLEGYNFYMQLHPVGLKYFDHVPPETNLSNRSRVPINENTASTVDRYIYIADPSIEGNIKYLKYDNEAVHYRLSMWVW